MTQDQLPEQPADSVELRFPPLTETSEDASSPGRFATRAQRRNGAPSWMFLVAILLGGLFAVGIVKMLPDRWLPQRNAQEEDRAERKTNATLVESEKPKRDAGTSLSDANELATPNPTDTPPQRTVDQSFAAAASHLVRRREDEAASLLKRAEALRKIDRDTEARQLIERILNRYDDTKAAVDAEKLLRTINRR